MQAKYAEKPVKFLLVPCNQFGAQEPKPDAQIKEFAEKSVTLAQNGAGSNVIMLAKSNLNGQSCTASDNVCLPSSAECCPPNDVVYDYLLSVTPPGTIKWNFDKIIVGPDGRPFLGETILHGDVLDAQLSELIDAALPGRVAKQMWWEEGRWDGKQIITREVPMYTVVLLGILAVLLTCVAVVIAANMHSEREFTDGYFLAA